MGAECDSCALCLLVDPSRFACRFRPRPLGSVMAFGDEWEPPHPLAEGNHPPGAHLVPYPTTRCIALRAIPEAGKPHACFAWPYLPLRLHESPRNTPRTVSPNHQPAMRAYGGKLCQSPRSLGASQVAPRLTATFRPPAYMAGCQSTHTPHHGPPGLDPPPPLFTPCSQPTSSPSPL